MRYSILKYKKKLYMLYKSLSYHNYFRLLFHLPIGFEIGLWVIKVEIQQHLLVC